MLRNLNINTFFYDLPKKRVAKFPIHKRSHSRMLLLDRVTQTVSPSLFTDIGSFITSNDLIIINNTRVFSARLYPMINKGKAAEKTIEVVLDRWNDNQTVPCICNTKLAIGDRIYFKNNIIMTVVQRSPQLLLLSPFKTITHYYDWIHAVGSVPIPRYLERDEQTVDTIRYHSVFAQNTGSIASPTASLHFDNATTDALLKQGVEMAPITLHCSFGTFLPIRTKDIADHTMQKEYYSISKKTLQDIQRCKQRGGRVIAIGTTVVRALESLASEYKYIPGDYHTSLFIKPGYSFKLVDGVLTNFHSPKSTPLVLTVAFAGASLVEKGYRLAIERKYRFLSYGDCMLIL